MSFISSQIQVAIRVRPFLFSENSNESILYLNQNDDRKITLRKAEHFYEGYYDQVFTQNSTQKDIYEFIKPLINDIKKGINSTVFTYGQTGSGKTYTMFGSDWTDPIQALNYHQDKYNFIQNDLALDAFSVGNGIIPRAINDIIYYAKDFNIHCSYLQIYNEKLYDLLEDDYDINHKEMPFPKFSTYVKDITTVNPIQQKPLLIRETKESTYIEGLNEYSIETLYDCLDLLKKGEKMRKKRQTMKNDMSSRSHTILVISLMSKVADSNGCFKKAKVHFCDLAGSEKYDSKATYIKYHFNEMVNINKSLSTLGKVINALANKRPHIPYRDSKLTQLLQNSLGGNTKTFLIANISSAKESYEETVSTLKFADCVHNLFTKVEPNTIEPLNMNANTNLVVQLTQELNELKQLLNARRKKGTLGAIEEELIQLREENEQLRKYNGSNIKADKLIKENINLKNQLKKMGSRNTTSHSSVTRDNCFAITGNNIINTPSNNLNDFYWKNSDSKGITKELQTASNRLKALEKIEYNSRLKMNKEIEMIKMKHQEKLFSRRKGKLPYLESV